MQVLQRRFLSVVRKKWEPRVFEVCQKNIGKMLLDYDCPHCGEEMFGEFGDDVTCNHCKLRFATDWDYSDDDNIACWLTSDGVPVDEKISENDQSKSR